MKKLTFKNGTKTYFTDDSTILNCKMVLSKFAEIDDVAKEFTVDNLNGGTFDEVEIENIIPVSVSATKSGDNVVVNFINRNKTQEELLQDKMDELDRLMAELKGQA